MYEYTVLYTPFGPWARQRSFYVSGKWWTFWHSSENHNRCTWSPRRVNNKTMWFDTVQDSTMGQLEIVTSNFKSLELLEGLQQCRTTNPLLSQRKNAVFRQAQTTVCNSIFWCRISGRFLLGRIFILVLSLCHGLICA
jgi:hypothetical protein